MFSHSSASETDRIVQKMPEKGGIPISLHSSAQLQQQIEFSTQKCLKREISQFLCTGLLEPTSAPTSNMQRPATAVSVKPLEYQDE